MKVVNNRDKKARNKVFIAGFYFNLAD